MTASTTSIEQLSINTIRTLSMDGVQQANSGHPGTPMALAPVTYVLWNEFMNYDPADPTWMARDRFVLSCGHASMLLYSLIHVAGIKALDINGKPSNLPSLTVEDLKNFRQMHSPCAGHPEFGYAAGIETTTGPLGQGIGNSVGMAIAAEWMAARYNKPGFDLFGNDVYALCSDGDVMEGVGMEAASIAGHLKLSNLCWVYDDNHITIEGDTELAFTEDVATRFEGMGWNIVKVDDANDLAAISAAFKKFKATSDKPTLIVLRSIIAWGSPNKANTHGAHGSPLGEEEIQATKEVYGWDRDAKFKVPEEVLTHFADNLGKRGAEQRAAFEKSMDEYKAKHAGEAAELEMIANKELPAGWEDALPVFSTDEKSATRVTSGKVLNAVAARIPWMLGGSADLAPSTKTNLNFDGAGAFLPGSRGGRNFHWGIREHGMAAAANGMSLCGLRAYVATFFVFSDYLRPSMRLSAIMHQPVLYVFTHDSIGLGEDGPTHQPVEHLAACRSIPGLVVIRPGDANEVSDAYRSALSMNDRPVALVLTRQNIPTLDRETYAASG
ncbi:MAG: transketolase, partial [Planctomycetota bacterium]